MRIVLLSPFGRPRFKSLASSSSIPTRLSISSTSIDFKLHAFSTQSIYVMHAFSFSDRQPNFRSGDIEEDECCAPG